MENKKIKKTKNLKQSVKDTVKDIEKEIKVESPDQTDEEMKIAKFVEDRIYHMKEYRKTLKIEDKWKEADIEYVPSELTLNKPHKKRFEQDQDTGLRSKMVPIGGDEENWRSNNSDTTLLTKIQTAISILVDRNPTASLVALQKKYENTTDLIYSLWKRNWEINNSKEIYKLFIFNLMKYGWAPGRVYPKVIKYPKKVLVQIDSEDPTKNVYEERENIWFDDICKQNLDPRRTWIDEMSKPYQPSSTNDWYFEVDVPYDLAAQEYEKYPNWSKIDKDSRVLPEEGLREDENMLRKDIVTLGFYENRLKDLFVIYSPTKKIVIHSCPLPNDDGMLSLFHTLWILRSAESPYGISLWDIIRQDKELYDKFMNMTMDQLVLSISKMFFYTGTSNVLGDGKIKIKPGVGKQIVNGKIDWLEVPGPGTEAWEGLKFLKRKMDDNSGITPTLEGEVTGKTLGEILHAKEAALKRMKMPLDNVLDAMEQDAYITISWMSQKYTTPEIKNFTDIMELKKYEEENQTNHSQLFEVPPANEEDKSTYQATYYPNLALHLEDSDGKLIKSDKSSFFQIGKDIEPGLIKWRGIFKIIPGSMIAVSEELEQQKKAQLANQLAPLLVQPPELYLKIATEMVKSAGEDPEDWLPDSWLQPAQEQQPLIIPSQDPMMQQAGPNAQPGGSTMQNQAGVTPNKGGQQIVPQNQLPKGAQVNTQFKGFFK